MSNKITGSDLERLINEAMLRESTGRRRKQTSTQPTQTSTQSPSTPTPQPQPKAPVEDIEEKARLARVNISNIEAVKKLDDSAPETVKRMYDLAKARLSGDKRREEERIKAAKDKKDAEKAAQKAELKAQIEAEKEELRNFLNSVGVKPRANANLTSLQNLKTKYEKDQAIAVKGEEESEIKESQEENDHIYYFDRKTGTFFTETAVERIFTLTKEQFDYLVSSSDTLSSAKPQPLDPASDIGRIFFTTKSKLDLNALNVEFTPDIPPAFLHDLATPLNNKGMYYNKNKILNPKAISEKDFRIAKHKIIMHFFSIKKGKIKQLQLLALLAGDGKILNDDDITSFLMSTDEEVVAKIKSDNESFDVAEAKYLREVLKQILREISQLKFPKDKDFTSMGLDKNEKLTSKQFKELKTTARAHLARASGEEVRKTPPSKYKPDVRLSKKYKGYAVLESTPQYVLDIFENSGVSSGNSLKERLVNLTKLTKSIFKEKESQLSISEVTANDDNDSIEANFSDLMLFDFFKKIAYDLGPLKSSTDAGFYFETFLALLTGGTVEGGGSNVEDIILPPNMKGNENSVFVSAKLISENTQVAQAGSTVNNFFNKHGKDAKFIYVVAYKLKYREGERMTTAEFPVFVKTYSKEDFPDLDSPDDDGVYRSQAGVTFYPPGDFKAPPAQSFKYKGDQGKMFGDVGGREEFDPSDSFKDSQASGTYVFEIDKLRNEENLVGTILIPADIKQYNESMEKSFESLNLNIKKTYSKLEKFEETLVSFYSFAGRKAEDQVALATGKKGKEAESSFIDLKSEVSKSLKLGGFESSSLQESKITPVNIKKLIEESFKK